MPDVIRLLDFFMNMIIMTYLWHTSFDKLKKISVKQPVLNNKSGDRKKVVKVRKTLSVTLYA